jgi:serine/threonine protein kinase/tetratricopeptide (TPR) repeat protein
VSEPGTRRGGGSSPDEAAPDAAAPDAAAPGAPGDELATHAMTSPERPEGVARPAAARVGHGDPTGSLPFTDLSAAPRSEPDRLVAALVAAPPPDLAPGTVVGHGFRVDRPLGSGGMGVVYLARDLVLQRDVALKLHRAHAGLDRLQREAVAMARLAHPNVITVHEIGRVGNRLFVAMEYVPGTTLRGWLHARRRSWREVVAIMRQVAAGLAAAHDAGLVHRDFKPENVLVGADGRPRVGDFGLARVMTDSQTDTSSGSWTRSGDGPGRDRGAVRIDGSAETMPGDSPTPGPAGRRRTGPADEPVAAEAPTLVPDAISTEDEVRLTVTGAVIGTPAYMAPEQVTGGAVDARADQFSFCVTFWEALHGERPFTGKTHKELMAAIERGQRRPPPPGHHAPGWLRRIISRGLVLDPGRRWPTLRALIAAIDAAQRKRRIAAVAGVAAAATAAVALAAAIRPDAAVDACRDAGAEIDGAWTLERRTGLEAAFAAADPTRGPQMFERLSGRLDAWRARYRTAATAVCRAARVEQTWTADLHARGQSCLGERLAVLTTMLGDGAVTRQQVPDLVASAAALPLVEACADPTALAAMAAAPARADTLARVRDLRERLLKANRRDRRGTPEVAAELATVEKEAEALGFAPLLVEVRLARGIAAARADDWPAAEKLLGDAYFQAHGLDAAHLALDAARWMIHVVGVDQYRMADAQVWVNLARAEAARDPYGAHLVHHALAALADRRGDGAAAVVEAERALAAHQEIGGDDPLERAMLLDELGTALDRAGRSQEGIGKVEEALAEQERVLGADHPRLIGIIGNLVLSADGAGDTARSLAYARRLVGLVAAWPDQPPVFRADGLLNASVGFIGAGLHAEARPLLEQAQALYASERGPDSAEVAFALANLGLVHDALGDLPAAVAAHRRAVTIEAAVFDANHTDLAHARTNLATTLRKLGRCGEALPEVDRAVAAFASSPDLWPVVAALTERAQCRLATRDVTGAFADFTAAERQVADRGTQVPVRYRAGLLEAHGKALYTTGRDRAGGRAKVDAARGMLASDPSFATTVADLDRWLASHR